MTLEFSDEFQLYDYGLEGNKIAYSQKTPPLYNLSAITSPVAIYYGKSDPFITALDGARMAAEIPNCLHFVLGRGTNHLDVQWGKKAFLQPPQKFLLGFGTNTESHRHIILQ
ncbi:hypothetical protein NQ315_007596 [Exocentrus adspersus]|uniref:Uncharacterized protein n=1 Tax=Exocentrus adspersus TaxID=1586481 RepID=A0AAV8W8P7_9CUCU|nr:hypothetical protein NQ315_007596 [Exocentrus adspersus]